MSETEVKMPPTPASTPSGLKHPPESFINFSGSSYPLVRTVVTPIVGNEPRAYYLSDPLSSAAPIISVSPFVPSSLVTHLMRRKNDSAIGVKFAPVRHGVITNMEGALHTFVTPIVSALMHGDYRFMGGHRVVEFPPIEGKEQARKVIVSASIQMDFEYKSVMMAVCRVEEKEVVGMELGESWTILGDEEKWAEKGRKEYDDALRSHLVAHLTASKRLPSLQSVKHKALSIADTLQVLEQHIKDPNSSPQDLQNVFTTVGRINTEIISIELLYNTAVHQLRNELSALEAACPQGYIYTSDPPSIFAQALGNATLLNRLQFAALKHLASTCKFANMRVFAFNDYADSGAILLLKEALRSQPNVLVMPKGKLFQGMGKWYMPGEGLEECLLVVHNNSDAFGQNIETEWATGSLDGAIGASTSAAASLLRNRKDLLDWIM